MWSWRRVHSSVSSGVSLTIVYFFPSAAVAKHCLTFSHVSRIFLMQVCAGTLSGRSKGWQPLVGGILSPGTCIYQQFNSPGDSIVRPTPDCKIGRLFLTNTTTHNRPPQTPRKKSLGTPQAGRAYSLRPWIEIPNFVRDSSRLVSPKCFDEGGSYAKLLFCFTVCYLYLFLHNYRSLS